MEKTIIILFAVSQIILALFMIYHGSISIFGFFPVKKIKHMADPKKRFAVVIAAHNEEAVVASLIKSLAAQEYPKELFDVMVIADNCTDKTAEIARANGALAFERFNKKEVGKGFALQWMFDQIYEMNRHDAIIVLDADNLVNPTFLLHFNQDLIDGHKVIQSYLDSKNPDDTWITKSYAISYWYMARIWQVARQRVGLPGALGGTGMCFEIETLKEVGWDATSLTEDLEFTMKAILMGIKPKWNHFAKIYDEKPLTLAASWNQRLRWMQGHWDVAHRYTKKLLMKFIKEGDRCALDGAFYMLQPVRIVLAYFSLLVSMILWITPNIELYSWLEYGSEWPLFVWILILMFQWVFPPLVAAIVLVETKKISNLMGLVYYHLFGLSWFPLTVLGYFSKDNKIWSHTQHVRNIETVVE